MLAKIIKRDGREVPFNIEKISQAIAKASVASGGKGVCDPLDLSIKVAGFLENELGITAPTVEEIQDAVERVLIEEGYARTAKAYILYRAERTRIREMNTRLMKTFEDLTFKEAQNNDLKRENANINGDTAMGTMLKYGSEGSKQFYEMFVLNPAHSRAHREGEIHIHDLDFFTLTTTCCQIDIEKLFTGGFSTGNGHLREPNDISSYAALCCIAIQSNQNDQHGGQSIPNFDYGMASGVIKTYKKRYRQNLEKALALLSDLQDPAQAALGLLKAVEENTGLAPTIAGSERFVREEQKLLSELLGGDKALTKKVGGFCREKSLEETDKATYQAMEALIHNLNTMHSRAGAQVPFSSINYGTDVSPEGRMVTKNILLATDAGLGNGETSIFPIHIFKVKEGVNYNKEDPNYDLFRLACRVSAKRLFPNFSFIDAPFNLQYYVPGRPETEIAYMGCRTRVIGNLNDPSREIVTGRGNLSFTTINLPALALRANKNIDIFFEELDRKADLVIKQLLERFEIQAKKKVRNFPFLMGCGIWLDSDTLGPDDEIREVLKHGSLSVGFIGLAEALVALVGEHHGMSDRAQNLGLEIVSFLRQKTDEAGQKYKLNFTLLATPAEGTAGRFVRIDRKKYGEIPGVTDRDYYTNSFHVPVYYNIAAFDKIKKEAPYHELTNAGHITYVELDGDLTKNVDAFESVIRAMKEQGVGYGSINHPVDRDPACGYNGIIGDECPGCGRKESEGAYFERIRRITGYLVGTLDRFNDAKRAEEKDRVKHGLS